MDQQTEKTNTQADAGGAGGVGSTAMKAVAAAAAAGAAAVVARKAFSHDNGSSNGSSKQNGSSSEEGGSKSLTGLGSLASGGWDAARDALLPAAEDAAGAAGAFVAENAPEIVRDRIVPRFIESFNDARGG
jgi:hypothetical protein